MTKSDYHFDITKQAKRLTAKKLRPLAKRLLSHKTIVEAVIICLVLCVGISFIPFSHTGIKTVSLNYSTQSITTPSIELGDTKINQQGVNGSSLEKYKYKKSFIEYLFGTKVSETQVSLRTVKQPTNEVIANGTLRYQYMYCSNGSYRSYTDAQMKDPTIGLTHKSPDYCAQNNQGTETQLANVPPVSNNTKNNSSAGATAEINALGNQLSNCITTNNDAYSFYIIELNAAKASLNNSINLANIGNLYSSAEIDAITGYSWETYNKAVTDDYNNIYLSGFKGTDCTPDSPPPTLYELTSYMNIDMALYPQFANW